jgi:hypothetical protein
MGCSFQTLFFKQYGMPPGEILKKTVVNLAAWMVDERTVD